MPCPRSSGRAASAGSGPARSTPTRRTTPGSAATPCAGGTSPPRIARKGVERSDRLGRHRWVVERTLAWLNRFRRLAIRDERRGDLHQGFLLLACSLICLRRIEGRF